MRNIRYDNQWGLELPREVQIKRVQRVIQEELTALQREALIAYYFQEQTITQIAEERGVNKSTVCRTLHRAEEKLRRYLRCMFINLILFILYNRIPRKTSTTEV